MHWSFNKTSDAPWYNGSCESLIRLVKNGIVRTVDDGIISFAELQTTLFEVSNMLNESHQG